MSPGMTFDIRPLRVDEVDAYRAIRLEALRFHPEAFASSFESEAAQPAAFFAERLSRGVIFGGLLGDALLGTAGFMIHAGAKTRHKAMFWGMYVRPEARGSGLARGLVEAVLEHARDRVELVQLSVAAENVRAQRLYAQCGFVPYGVEQRALKIDGRYLDDVLMVRMLP
jgi:RimJ/RimL family protein N-acetyltransferase